MDWEKEEKEIFTTDEADGVLARLVAFDPGQLTGHMHDFGSGSFLRLIADATGSFAVLFHSYRHDVPVHRHITDVEIFIQLLPQFPSSPLLSSLHLRRKKGPRRTSQKGFARCHFLSTERTTTSIFRSLIDLDGYTTAK